MTPSPPEALVTERCRLRRLRPGDGPALRELEADPAVMRTTGLRTVQSADASAARLARTLAEAPGHEPLGVWGAFRLDPPHDLCGWVMLVPTRWPGPELGFMVPRRLWGLGFATELAHAVVRHADRLGLGELWAVTDPDNRASQRVLERVGFARVDETPSTVRFRRPPPADYSSAGGASGLSSTAGPGTGPSCGAEAVSCRHRNS